MFPIEKVTGFPFGEEFVGDKGLDEAVAKEFGEGIKGLCGGGREEVEAAGLIEESAGAEDVKMGMEYEVIAEGLNAGDGGEFSVGEIELKAHPVAEGFGGGAKEVVEEVAALAENTAQHAGHGEDELAVWNGLAEGFGDPVAGGTDAPLVASRTDVAALASKGEEALVAAVGIGTDEAGESGGEVAAFEEIVYGLDGEGS